ncbi:MAG: M15 family metallopeptidase [Burkholderiales bacterium]
MDNYLDEALSRLGIDNAAVAARNLPFHPEAGELVVAEVGADGREYLMTPDAARAWQEMKASAALDDVTLIAGSAFRSIARQIEIIEKNLAEGRTIDDILTSIAVPGYSEHHTGRAIDIVSMEVPDTEEAFEETAAFAWLAVNAARFGFAMSYPRGNADGYVYEPWHWCYHPGANSPCLAVPVASA